MKKKNKLSLLMLFALVFSSACQVEGGKHSSTSSSSFISSSSSSSSLISTGLPLVSQEFVDAVNNIVVDINAGADITHAFDLYNALEGDTWDYYEVLDAFERLCEYEEQYNLLLSNYDKIELFLEKVFTLPSEITLDDEYLIIRAEDSYNRLPEKLRTLPEIVTGYEIICNYRETFDKMYVEAMEKKDNEDVAKFLSYVGSIPNNETLDYSIYFTINEALAFYELMSDKAKAFEGVLEGYNKLIVAQGLIDVQDGSDLFDINIIHKANNYECMLDIQGKNPIHKVTGTDKVYELKIYENNVIVDTAKILKWGDAPVATSYTRDNGIHSFSFSLGKYYNTANTYQLNFIIRTDIDKSYAVTLYYMVDGSLTCHGHTAKEFYSNLLIKRESLLIKSDYNEAGLARIKTLLADGLKAIENATTDEHARLIYSQYFVALIEAETIFAKLSGVSLAGVSSREDTANNMLDGKDDTSWQAATYAEEYIILDLGQVTSVAGFSIIWANANAKEYTIKVSNENGDWETVESIYHFTNGVTGKKTEQVRLDEYVDCRYIRFDFVSGTMSYGYRIYEIDVLQDKYINN